MAQTPGPEAPGASRQPSTMSESELTSMFRRVQQMTYTVTCIVPAAMTLLVNLLREHFPHQRYVLVHAGDGVASYFFRVHSLARHTG